MPDGPTSHPEDSEKDADVGKVVLVTGVTRGLGRALALELLRRGHAVAGCGRDAEALASLRREAQRRAPSGAEARLALREVDVRDGDRVAEWVESAVAALGPIDLAVCNAARMNRLAPLWDVPAEEMDAMLAVNVAGIGHVTRAVAPAMIERGRGVLVFFSSGWGRSTAPGVGPYCVTKWAVEGFARALADDLPAGVASVAVNPGIIDTDMLRACFGDGAGGYPDAEEWAKTAAPFLLGLGAEHGGKSLDAP